MEESKEHGTGWKKGSGENENEKYNFEREVSNRKQSHGLAVVQDGDETCKKVSESGAESARSRRLSYIMGERRVKKRGVRSKSGCEEKHTFLCFFRQRSESVLAARTKTNANEPK